jgi:hypothetical protein
LKSFHLNKQIESLKQRLKECQADSEKQTLESKLAELIGNMRFKKRRLGLLFINLICLQLNITKQLTRRAGKILAFRVFFIN